MRLQRKMYEANKALSYFVTHNWNFKNDNFISLCTFMRLEDVREFDFRDVFTFDMVLAARHLVLGYRRYLLKEKDESLPRCRLIYRRMEIVNDLLKLIPFVAAFYLCFVKYNILSAMQGLFEL